MTVVRYASVIQLKPGAEAEYRQLHAAVWPAVARRIKECNIRNYSIFLRDGVLFSYFEYTGVDYDADMAAMAADDETRRWWALTDPCQQPVGSAEPGQWWAPMAEVFHLD
jgi:L-rhamnose mutarotase